MIPTPCIEAGCPNMATPGPRSSRCRPCQRQWDRARERRPSRGMYRDPAYRAMVIPATCMVEGCDRPATKDHIVELEDGGTNEPSNIQALCREHNSEKSNARRAGRVWIA